jgi:hypothetical protein
MTVVALDIAHELEERSLAREPDSLDSVSSSAAAFVEPLESPPHAVKQKLDRAQQKINLTAEFTVSSYEEYLPRKFYYVNLNF